MLKKIINRYYITTIIKDNTGKYKLYYKITKGGYKYLAKLQNFIGLI